VLEAPSDRICEVAFVLALELPAPAVKGLFTVSANLLCELFADQINNVSLEFVRPSQTLVLTAQQTRATFTV
jgi:hypothetical protein